MASIVGSNYEQIKLQQSETKKLIKYTLAGIVTTFVITFLVVHFGANFNVKEAMLYSCVIGGSFGVGCFLANPVHSQEAQIDFIKNLLKKGVQHIASFCP